jgi:hypothetical protein
MAFQLKKPGASVAAATKNPAPQSLAGKPPAHKAPGGAKALPSWMATGSKAKKLEQVEEAKVEQAKEAAGKMRRFWMTSQGTPGYQSQRVIFLDGALDPENQLLDIPRFFEHTAHWEGRYQDFLCISQAEPCPFCEAGDKAAFVGIMTVLCLTPYTVKNGPNAGKVISNYRQLYVPKRQTIKQLHTIAVKRGGLVGCEFEIDRSTDKSPKVGDMFEFVEKHTKADLIAKYGAANVVPADYATELVYRDAAALAKMGITSSSSTVGSEKPINTDEVESEL